MKYKKKLIQDIKDKYGVSDLFFYRGYKLECFGPTLEDQGNYLNIPITICSIMRSCKKVYRKRKDIVVVGRYTHVELEYILRFLLTQSKPNFTSLCSRIILFEQCDAEFEDLYSLKQAYLISRLAGI